VTSDHVDKTVVQPAADDAAVPGTRRTVIMLAAVAALLAAGAVALVLMYRSDSLDLEAALRGDISTLSEQVRGLGGTPVVTAPGEPGAAGPPGVDGRDGANGLDGKNGADGTTPPCLGEPRQCRGDDGRNGLDGTDATGEPGLPGEQGQPGRDATGVPGPPGPTGEKGDTGQAGVPPAGWTWVDSEGRQQSCARDTGSPDSAPTYTCTAPSPEPTGLPILRRSP
jgi:hypothetical protein